MPVARGRRRIGGGELAGRGARSRIGGLGGGARRDGGGRGHGHHGPRCRLRLGLRPPSRLGLGLRRGRRAPSGCGSRLRLHRPRRGRYARRCRDRDVARDQLCSAGRDNGGMGRPGGDEVARCPCRASSGYDDECPGGRVGWPRHRERDRSTDGRFGRGAGLLFRLQSPGWCGRCHGDGVRGLRRRPGREVDRRGGSCCGEADTAREGGLARYEQEGRERCDPLPRSGDERLGDRLDGEGRQHDRRQRRGVEATEHRRPACAFNRVERLVRGRDHDLEAAVELPPADGALQHGGSGITGGSDGPDRRGQRV